MKISLKVVLLIALSMLMIFCTVNFYVSAEESVIDTQTAYDRSEQADTEHQRLFDLEISVPESIAPGEELDVVITVKNVRSKNGLIAIDFQLSYNMDKVDPLIVSERFDDSKPYDAFLIKSPQYIMDVNGQEISASCYENFCRCYNEGCIQTFYSMQFIDKMIYPMMKDGTDPDPVLKEDGDMIISVPFRVKEDAVIGDRLFFEVTMVSGTDAGDEKNDPASVIGSDSFSRVDIVAPQSTDTQSETQQNISEETSVDGTEMTASQAEPENSDTAAENVETDVTIGDSGITSTAASTGDTQSDINASQPLPDVTPKTYDGGLDFAFILSLISLLLFFAFCKTKKND